jgi:hypothetical protein
MARFKVGDIVTYQGNTSIVGIICQSPVRSITGAPLHHETGLVAGIWLSLPRDTDTWDRLNCYNDHPPYDFMRHESDFDKIGEVEP